MTAPQPGDIVRYDDLYYEVVNVDGDTVRLRGLHAQDTLTAPASACTVVAQQVSMVEVER